jgi:hypothetical protein
MQFGIAWKAKEYRLIFGLNLLALRTTVTSLCFSYAFAAEAFGGGNFIFDSGSAAIVRAWPLLGATFLHPLR